MQQEYLQIGEIVRPQGIRGEVKLRAMTEDMSRYARLESVFLKKNGQMEEKKVLKGRSYDGFAFLQLEGVNDRDAAEALRGAEVYVDRKHAIKLGADENFVCELIGLKAVDENGEVVDGDKIIYIFGCQMKREGRLAGNKVVTTVMSNFGLYKALDEVGVGYEKTAVGDRFVYENMAQNGYCVGGEQSGHIILSKYATTGDGILTSIELMEAMLDSKQTLSRLAAPVAVYPQVLKNVRVSDKAAVRENAHVQQVVKAVGERLGDTGRVLLRESGTEPVIRVMAEAQELRTAEACVNEMIEAIKAEGLA